MGWRDEWPLGSDGEKHDGKRLLELVRNDVSPFKDVWGMKLLIAEIEEKLHVQVTDIPIIDKGSNNYVRATLCLIWGRLIWFYGSTLSTGWAKTKSPLNNIELEISCQVHSFDI